MLPTSLLTTLSLLASSALCVATPTLSSRDDTGPAAAAAAAPTPPATEFLFTVTIESAGTIAIGQTPLGQRLFSPIQSGTFSGPHLQGNVIGGLDAGLTDADGHFDPDVVYLLQTDDGSNVLVREQGHAPNVVLLFETVSGSGYDWLNDVVAYGLAAQSGEEVSVDVWKIGIYEN